MKTISTCLLLVGMIPLVSCDKEDQYPSNLPAPTADAAAVYSNEELDEMIVSYYSQPAERTQSPANISTKFSQQFPGAYDMEWSASQGIYKVDFDIKEIDYDAWYDAGAYLLQYKYDIPLSLLPGVVSGAIKQKYSGYRIDDADRVVKGKQINYLVSIENKASELNVYYNEDGTFINEKIDY